VTSPILDDDRVPDSSKTTVPGWLNAVTATWTVGKWRPERETPTCESVDSAPASRDVEQGEEPDAFGERRVDDEVVADGLQTEHRAQEKEWGSR
jgi:hypothetical protein